MQLKLKPHIVHCRHIALSKVSSFGCLMCTRTSERSEPGDAPYAKTLGTILNDDLTEIKDIIELIKDLSGTSSEVSENSDIFADIGMTGDDFHDLLDKYAKIFKVDMSPYIWYFHADEESGSNNLGGIFFAPPYKKVKRIPVTPKMLLDFAIKGKWDMIYPKHNISNKGYDLLINKLVLICFFIGIVIWIVLKIIK